MNLNFVIITTKLFMSDTSYLFTVYSIFPYSLTHICDSKSHLFSRGFKLQLNVCFSFHLKDICLNLSDLSMQHMIKNTYHPIMYFSILLLLHTCLLHVVTSAQCFQMLFIFVLFKREEFVFSAHSKQWAKLHFHFFYFMRPGL